MGKDINRPVMANQRLMRLLGFQIDGTVTGEKETSTVTVDAFANINQAEMIELVNASGESVIIWFDLNAAGTAPTGAKYTGLDHEIEVDIVTGDNTAAAVGAKVKAAFDAYNAVTATGIALVDNEDGTLTATNDADNAATDGAPYDADSTAYSGGGALAVAVTNQGVTAAISITKGSHDGDLTADDGPGDYTITFAKPFAQVPTVVASPLTADRICQIAAVSTTAVQIKTLDATDGTTAKDCDFHLLVFGSDETYEV